MAEPERPADPPAEDLVAYLDGELDEQSTQAVESRLTQDAALRDEANALKRTWDLLDYLPKHEPSPTFTTRTLDKLAALRPAGSATANRSRTATATAARQRRWPLRLAAVAAALALVAVGFAAGGWFSHSNPSAAPEPADTEEQMARDLRVLDNMHLLPFADDMKFLKALDDPDLFGDDAAGE